MASDLPEDAAPATVAVTMLSGFLGAGKTTLLRHLLQNTDLKIGCIVNDVASVNIDAKLIRNDARGKGDQPSSTSDLADTIELANGCACCSIADELFVSFDNLLEVAARRGVTYDRIVLENSGVAEPQNIRDQFTQAALDAHPVLKRVHLDTLVTVVDSQTFIKDFSSRAPVAARPELGDGGGMRPVVDLLVEQVECADFVVLNKMDQVEGAAVAASLGEIVRSLNPLARVVSCSHGQVPLAEVFGRQASGLLARLNVEGQHRGAVAAARSLQEEAEAEEREQKQAKHEHPGEGEEEGCAACNHDHSHDHSHKHSHEHSHGGEGQEGCAACEQEHAHEPKKGEGHTHAHAHEHQHQRQSTTAAKRFGIVSFVYCRRRPFHPQRLKDLVLRWMPVSTNKALVEGEEAGQGDSPIKTVLRSKGFMWIANSHTTAFFWSHAGQHFEIRDEGEWWAVVPDQDWPQHPQQLETVLADFDLKQPAAAGAAAKEASAGDPSTAAAACSWGDRRQEIVFIGAAMDRPAITAQLDSALLSEQEMEQYMQRYSAQPDPPHAAVQAALAAAAKAQ